MRREENWKTAKQAIRWFSLMVLVLFLFFTWECGVKSVKPNAGYEAVLIEKPILPSWLVGKGGVNRAPVYPGRKYVWWTTDHIMVYMLPDRIDMEFDDMMTKSGVPVSFHIVATIRVTNSADLVEHWGADVDDKGNWGFWLRNLDQPIRTAVRDSVKKREMQEMAIDQSAADAVVS